MGQGNNIHPVSFIASRYISSPQLNTFHWHIVDAQSFPIQIADFPEVSAKGAYSSKLSYSVKDVQEIVAYAAAVSID